MASDWQKILDDFAGSRASSNPSANKSSSTKSTSTRNTSTTSTSKKKKKDDWQSILDDFAGTRKTESTVSERVEARTTVSNDKKWYEGYFQKGAFGEGFSIESVSKALLGSGADLMEDITTGLVGMGESVVDAFAQIAPYVYQGNLAVNGVVTSPEQKKLHDNVVKEMKKENSEFIAKDLYDENKVAKQILANVYGAANNAMKTQNGQQLTTDDIIQQKESVKTAQKYLDETMESQSVLGEKTDSMAQSLGHRVGSLALQSVGVPWWMTYGVTTFGSEAENAYKEGATYEQATGSAAISAAAEIASEKLFGGSGLGEKGVINLDPLTRGISNKIAKTLLDYGIDIVAEGGEEVFTEVVSKLGTALYREENLSEILGSEEAFNDYIHAFISGGAMSGIMNVGKAAGNAIEGTDYRDGLTQNEQKVVDLEYQRRLEKEGKLSAREKSKLHAKVVQDMEKGYISTDIIEEALGGEKYENYKKAKDWEDSVQKEYDDLRKMKRGEMTGEQIDRETELKRMLDHISKTSNLGQVKAELSKDIYEMTKGDRLVESYFENVRANQKYEADLTKYEGKARDVIKQVMDSGLADNSNQTHEFWDMAAKIATDRDTNISIATNDEILEMVKKEYEAKGKAFDANNFKGKIIDGYWGENGIVLNAQTKRALNFVLGHEITHSLETANLYKDLPKLMQDFAPDEYKRRFDERAGQYENIYEDEGFKEKIEQEVIADMVGDILFTDKDFVKHLSTANRNVFQKMWDEVKYLCKKATAGSKEARQLEALKKKFEDVYREAGKAQGDGKYSVSETTDGRFAAVVDNDILSNIDTSSWDDTKKSEAKKAAAEALKQFKDGIVVDGITRKVNKVSRREYTRSNYTESLYNHAPDVFADKMRAAEVADDIVVAATNWQRDGGLKHPRTDDFVDFDRGKTLIVSGDAKYNAEVVVGITDTGEAVFYDVVDLQPATFDIKKSESPTTATTQNAIGDIQGDSFGNKVAQDGKNVKLSLSDSEGREVSSAVAKRFSNSKAVDENGNLKVLYHGTASGEFYIFDKSKGSVEGDFGSGFYFTDNETDVSDHYEGGGPDFENKVARRAEQIEADEDIDYEEAEQRAREELYKGSHKFEVYLNVENPAVVGETMLFDGESYLEQYNEEDYEDYDDYIADVEQLVADDIENIIWEVEKNVDVYSTDGLADVLFNAYYDGGIGIEELKAKINDLYLEDSNGNLVGNEVARQIIESLGYDGIIDPTVSGKWNMNMEEGTTHYIVFKPNQIKSVTNQNPTDNPDIRKSLSDVGQTHKGRGGWNVYSKYADVAPVAENATQQTEPQLTEDNATVTAAEMEEMFPDEPTPQTELNNLLQERESLESQMEEMGTSGDLTDFESVNDRYVEVATRIAELENEISESESGRVNSLGDADVPAEMEAPYFESNEVTVDNPFYDRDWRDVGSQKVKAFMTENPEVKPFFQDAALGMMYDIDNGTKGERFYNDQLHYESGGEKGWMGVKRHTTDDIADLLDGYGWSYADIKKGLDGILEDKPNSFSKRLEFLLNDRLMNGYTDVEGRPIPPNQDYINLLNEMQINKDAREAFDSLMPVADQYAPEDVAPVKPLAAATPDTMDAPIYQSKDPNTLRGQTTMFEPPKPSPSVATVLTEEAKKANEKSGVGKKMVSQLVDKGMVFENLSLETGNHELQAKYNYALPSNTEARAQYFMENGADGVKSLKDIMGEVNKTKKTEQFYNYLYHVHNIDRMTLEDRFDNTPNKTVFGETVTADVSRVEARKLEIANPEFRNWANDIYAYNKHLRNLLVEGNVISKETADLWEKMYPHYVPIRRTDSTGQNISVPLDSKKTGVNNPIKRATGGSSNIEPLFETMAMRTEQTFRAIARNSFGIELKNTLGTTIGTQENASVDDVIDTIEAQEEKLLKPGTMNSSPTFTVFENGERVEFEITEDMYEALKPAGKLLGHRIEALNKIGNFRRNLLTVWNPVFALYRNPIKDMQDVAVNSKHPVKTYLNVPNAIYQMATNGKWATEYDQNGGKSNTYFDSKTNKFKEDSTFKKIIGMPIRAVEAAGEFIEEIPRLAEYIASRQDGRSVERSMLDAARVTTNFAAGGDFTKFLNSHGFTFLNASVQGASQHVRNFREAKQQGLKGYVKVLAKYTVAGLPGILLNSLLWDDDEDYEELSDYVKQNYYVVAKTQDGKFVRIPKGRTAAVMQNAMEQMQNLVTGNDEVDFGTFFELFMNNIAPNNPIENNILAPIGQVWKNEAWYGGDLVPSRLQDLPAAEQFDESTDSISKWLGEKTNTSPYKWNYLLDQYSGGMGDVFLPMLTPEAESGDNTPMGNILAPWKKEITTDKVLNNKNPGDFYDLRDELEVKSNSRNATEEDAMRTMYMDSVSWDMSDLYKQKREVQNSDLPDDEKYEEVRKIQEQINELAKNAMSGYNNVNIDGLYSEVGDRRYNKDVESGKWYEIHEKNSDGSDNWYYQKEQEVTKALGISYGEYWNNREEYNYAYDKPGKYAIAQAVGGYNSYMEHYDVLENWQSDSYLAADKDEQGNSISGSRKEKVIDYINSLDADYGTKIILFRTVYSSKADKKAYNQDIIDYLNSRDDISYQEMKSILEELDFKVDSQGNITWD